MEEVAMHGWVWRAGSAAIAISLCAPPAGAVATGRVSQFAQKVPDAGRGPAEPSQSPAAAAPAAPRANTPEQIKKAQTELRRLECYKGRADGKLGDETRQAVKKFWASAKQPAVEVNVTDELIADLAARGDLFCRPPRPFFSIGGRSGGKSAFPPLLAPGARPGVPAPAAPPPAPAAAQ
jgi:peptidoglycan hydrolase-like protein with peptidoglycan-binding domain